MTKVLLDMVDNLADPAAGWEERWVEGPARVELRDVRGVWGGRALKPAIQGRWDVTVRVFDITVNPSPGSAASESGFICDALQRVTDHRTR
jgi:hypothetical protein